MLADGQQAPGHHCVAAFDVNQFGLTEHNGVSHQLRGRIAQYHPTRRCHRLHPLSHADLLTDGGVSQRPRTDLTGNHLAGIEAYPQPEVHAVKVSDVDGKPLCRFLKPQGRQAGTNGVVLQRNRCTEHGHDASPVNLSTVPP